MAVRFALLLLVMLASCNGGNADRTFGPLPCTPGPEGGQGYLNGQPCQCTPGEMLGEQCPMNYGGQLTYTTYTCGQDGKWVVTEACLPGLVLDAARQSD
jgi:hypothetical protein